MKKIFTYIIVIIAVSALLTACGETLEKSIQTGGTSAGDNPAGIVDATMMVIVPSIKGQTVSVNEGDTFQVSIPTIPVDGYAWKPDKLDTAILSEVGDSLYAASQDANSAGGNVILTFKAVGKGTTSLSLIYVQTDVAADKALYSKSFGVTVEVK